MASGLSLGTTFSNRGSKERKHHEERGISREMRFKCDVLEAIESLGVQTSQTASDFSYPYSETSYSDI
jgi:hypothetical protein